MPRFGCLVLILAVDALHAQAGLMLTSVGIPAGASATLDLSLTASRSFGPVAFQWTLQMEGVAAVTVSPGSALTDAGKTAVCSGDAATYKCLAVGWTLDPIADGILARITVAIPADAHAASIRIVDALGVNAGTFPIPLVTTDAKITVLGPSRRPARRVRH